MNNDVLIQTIAKLLTRASQTYAAGEPVLTDGEYDKLAADYKQLSGLDWYWEDFQGEVQHSRPMLSLHKSHSVEDYQKFLKRTGSPVVLMPKIDGLALALSYVGKAGKLKLVEALTRGKRVGGTTYGNSVLNNIKKASAFKHLNFLEFEGDALEVRGELYMPEEFFEAANEMRVSENKEPFKNVRNAAAGIIRNEGNSAYLKFLRFVAYSAFNPDYEAHEDTSFDTVSNMFYWLEQQGFNIPSFEQIALTDLTEDILVQFKEAQELPYQTDGVVICFNNFSDIRSAGITTSYPLYATAFKFEDSTAETTLLGVEWSATRTGRIVPKYIFEPVALEGTTVSQATGHNLANIKKLNIFPGDRIEVFKANAIIPQVKRLVKKVSYETADNLHPEACPKCFSEAVVTEVDLLCENPSCGAKLVELLQYACGRKNLDIDGMGESLAEALINEGLVTKFSDLFLLHNRRLELIVLKLGEKEITFGALRTKALLDNIEKAKQKPWSVVLHSLGCPGLGEPNCKAIAQRWGISELIDMLINDTLVDNLLKIKGMGKTTAETFTEWLENNIVWIMESISLGLNASIEKIENISSNKLEGLSFVVTGTLSVPRSQIEKIIEENGGKLSSSVSKKINYVVAGSDAGSKLGKAEEINSKAGQELVKIITEHDLKALVE